MAVDKLVDSTQLDSALSYTAARIRAKTGGASLLPFDLQNEKGFGDSVDAIPTGTVPSGTKQISITENGTVTEDVAAYANAEITVNVSGGGGSKAVETAMIEHTLSGAYENDLVTTLGNSALFRNPNLTSVSLPNCTKIEESGLRYCTSLTSVHLPKVNSTVGNYIFGGCTSLQVIALPSMAGTGRLPFAFQNDTALTTVDLGDHSGGITNQTFTGCTNFDTLILRCSTAVWVLGSTNVFNGTKFANGGAGGTVYIPKALYDHLGDGTALDYKAATNWSTVDGYGTITWAPIEGSQYENYYADGTPVS